VASLFKMEFRLMCNTSLFVLSAFALTISANAASEQASPVDVASARASLNGHWEGTLEYLDYSANEWFGIPVKTSIEDQGDKATSIRRSDFDDGPTVGNVRITSVELFDAAAGTITTGTFRKGREASITSYAVRIEGQSQDPLRWTLIAEVKAQDNNRPAMLRETTVRDGNKVETLKQVDFLDDDKQEWISRNRTKLTKIGD
jgi:hypothetical protein